MSHRNNRCDHCGFPITEDDEILVFGSTLANPETRVVHKSPCAEEVLKEAERKLRDLL